MTYRILVSAPHAQPIMAWYRAQLEPAGCEVMSREVVEQLSEEELLPIVGEIDGIICGDDRITERVFRAAPRLKVIAKWGTGVDSIDVEAAARRGVIVRNVPDAFTHPVADTVMGYILLFARKFDQLCRDMRSGRWEKRQGVALFEATLGVVGVGNCGRAVVRRAVPFGMRILGCDPRPVPDPFLKETKLNMVLLEELLRESDFVTLHVDLNASSRHLIDECTLRLMKPSAFLVNTARGGLVDEPALVKALDEKRIAGAALDVFEVEPLPPGSPLRRFEQVWLSPHTANSSPRAAQQVHERVVQNLLEVLKGRRGD
jgi:D-3-phosphoglycerate dehydrogenase